MQYVFDTGPFIRAFGNYYPTVFQSFWQRFDAAVADGTIVSVRDVRRELERKNDNASAWAKAMPSIFESPSAAEGGFVNQIYAVPHFQANISGKQLLKGGPHADPYLIAKGHVESRAVVTMEISTPNAARIPNICDHFGVRWVSFEQFMIDEGWTF